jgi:hypothetical protein
MKKAQATDSRPTLRAVMREAAAVRTLLQSPRTAQVNGYLLGIDAALGWFRYGNSFIRPSVMAIHMEEMYEAERRDATWRAKKRRRSAR